MQTPFFSIPKVFYLFLLLPPLALPAAEFVELPEQMVTATRTSADPFTLPYAATVLGSSNFRDFQPRTAADALERTTSVMLQRTAYGQVSPYIRGYTGFRTLLLVDGVRVNNSVFRSGPNQYWATIDSYSLDRLELVKGPVSVLYGSDAIGGVVNAITLPTGFTSASGWENRLAARASSAEQSYAGRVQTSYHNGADLSLVSGITFRRFGDLMGGEEVTEQNGTGYEEYAADGKLSWLIQPDLTLTSAWQHLRQNNVPRTHATVEGLGWRGLFPGTDRKRDLDQERSLGYVRLSWQADDTFVEEAQLTLSWQRQAEQEERIRSHLKRSFQSFVVRTLGTSLIGQSELRTFGKLNWGGEFYRDWVDSESLQVDSRGTITSRGIQGPVADDSTYDMLGIYLQDTWEWQKLWKIIAGARYHYNRADLGRYEDPVTKNAAALKEDWQHLVGSVRVLRAVGEKDRHHLYGGLSQGFRAPNLSDLSRLDAARSGEWEIPSPGLDAETYLSYEVGWKSRWPKAMQAEVAYYYTTSQGEIVRQPTGRTIDGMTEVHKANASSGHVQGLELSWLWKFGDEWQAQTNLTWQDGQVQSLENGRMLVEPISRLMPLRWEVALRYTPENQPFWLELVYLGSDRQNRLSAADKTDRQRIPPGGTPGYQVVSLYAGWKVRAGLQLYLSLQNIMNEDYRIHGSGVNAPGRNLVASADWRF